MNTLSGDNDPDEWHCWVAKSLEVIPPQRIFGVVDHPPVTCSMASRMPQMSQETVVLPWLPAMPTTIISLPGASNDCKINPEVIRIENQKVHDRDVCDDAVCEPLTHREP